MSNTIATKHNEHLQKIVTIAIKTFQKYKDKKKNKPTNPPSILPIATPQYLELQIMY